MATLDTVRYQTEVELKLRRLEEKSWPSLSRVLLPTQATSSALLLFLALLPLLAASGLTDWLKCGVIGLSAGVTAYAVNRYAIERGAVQAAIGSRIGGLAALGSVLAVGAGLAAATYAGLVIDRVDQLRLQGYATAHAAWVQDGTARSGEAARLLPVVGAIASDLERNVACEAAASCISGVGGGGQGPAYRSLLSALGRLQAALAELQAAERGQVQTRSEVSALQDLLDSLVVDDSVSGAMRRLQAAQASGRIGAALGALDATSPASLVRGLAGELGARSGNRPEDRLLASYGAQLAAALEGGSEGLLQAPAFPAATGVADTLRYIWHFLPIALLVAVIELILPTTLWVYAFIDLRARLEAAERAERTPPPVRKSSRTSKGRADQ